ncbi:universal stress protein [Sinorhizobium numidicum]|uniref:Universal stress protein n=1 Tax=Sinorhizobium numidicum TaxID=680248 RepID=A0ABY8CVC3_9HYPH|nr:universal stress protein [Sinorhizobium numidicum]WEX75270.1 universal stress protein [Sinorhizobium numidicum]WEX81265.1 universal stress protein [Sinorhizobium numidicum]
MAFRDIVVYLDGGVDTAGRVRTAVDLATKYQARLIGVDISTNMAAENHDAAPAIEQEFLTKLRGMDIDFEYRLASPDARTAQQLFSHCADLLIATQTSADDRHLSNSAVPEDVLLNAGVPMLVLPSGWTGENSIGNNVVVAWNFSREATRAVHDAMPVLELAHKVFLFIFASNYSDQNKDVQDIKAHLEHHGVTVALAGWRDHGETDMISALFAGLDREDADLIVCGAYSHSPRSEAVFGGATKDLLSNVAMPVLMSH